MTYDQYWGSNDQELLREYREADKLRQERANTEAWLHGAYIAKAIEATIGNAFIEKGAKKAEYPKTPIPLIKEKKPDIEPEQKKQNEALAAQAYMMQMVMAGKNWGKR